MSKLLVVFGATGNQGNSVARGVLQDPQLSKTFKVRAITRDVTKPEAVKLKELGAEVVAADFTQPESLVAATKGAQFVFAVTVNPGKPPFFEAEYAQGKAIADASVKAGAQFIIFSTLVSAKKVSGGKYNKVEHFDAKESLEHYIRKLPIKSAFFAPGFFAQNYSFMGPKPAGDGTYVLANVVSPQTLLPIIDIEDTFKFISPILANPDKYEGKFIPAAGGLYTFEQVAERFSQAYGKTVKYAQIPVETFKQYLPPLVGDELTEMFLFFQDFDYYGPNTREQVDWGKTQAQGHINSLEDVLKDKPFEL
jgi:uncharacterized protein YbjT (DUF2867 family)